MLGVGQCLGVIYDSHGRGLAALEGDLVSAKQNSLEDYKEFFHLTLQRYGPRLMESQKDFADPPIPTPP